MENQKKALVYGGIAVLVLAVAMVIFYYVQSRAVVSENDVDLSQKVESIQRETSPFVGLYAPSDGPLEAEQMRIGSFTVNRKEDGGYLGSAKVDSVGANDSFYFNCVDVRIEEKDFFLNCVHESKGSISLNGTWQKDASGAISVLGKVLWSKGGSPILDVQRQFQFTPGE